MPLHIGIVACSAEGAALCYRTICVEGAALLGPHAHPEVSMHTPSLADYVACLERGDWRASAALMLASADKLARDRRRFPDLPRQHHPSGAPLRRAALAAALAAHRRDRSPRRRSRAAIGASASPERAGSSTARSIPRSSRRAGSPICARPTPSATRSTASSWTSWSAASSQPEAVAAFQRVIGRMKGEGCDAVVLGCTEIPLIINDANSPLPTLDSTRLLARAALRRAVEGGSRR